MTPLLPARPATDRERARLTRFTFLLHMRPVRVPVRALRWTHTFGLGGSTLVLLLLLAASGTLQMLVYEPSPASAHASVTALERTTAFGALVRGVHWWSANLVVLVALLHAARTLLTGGHLGPRRFTWVLGALLMGSILAAAFTGYLLPWDQLSYWAVTVASGMVGSVPGAGPLLRRIMLGGEGVGDATLTSFYTLHTAVLPGLLVVLGAWHLWRVRRAGGVVVPVDQGEPASAMVWPELLVRETAQGLAVTALVFLLALVAGAPLGAAANPGLSPNPAKAPWYFAGFQELLIHLHPVAALLLIPLGGAVVVVLLPYLTPAGGEPGRRFLGARGRRLAVPAGVFGAAAATLLVLLDERLRHGPAGWLTGGLAPVAGLVLALAGCLAWARRRGGSGAEAVQAAVVMTAAAFLALTIIGAWLRGPGMALVLPFGGGGA